MVMESTLPNAPTAANDGINAPSGIRLDGIHAARQWPGPAQPQKPVKMIRHDDESQRFCVSLLAPHCMHHHATELQVCEYGPAPIGGSSNQVYLVFQAAPA
jgi:hypothetical protein